MRNSWYIALTLVSPIVFGPTAWAANDIYVSGLTQDVFKDLTNDLGAALSYKAISPAEPLGNVGFDIGFEVSSTRLESTAVKQAGGGSSDQLLVPKLSAHLGLPLGFDVGAFYTSIPDSNIDLVGGELKYAIFDGSTLAPAVAIRGTYSRLSGVNELDLTTRGLELSVSKGFAMFTPYAGIGTVWIDSDTSVPSLVSESLTRNKYFLGFNFNLGLMNFAAETEKTGDNATTSAKFGVRF